MSESVILCEGYHDRAFWAGWLEYLECENLGRLSSETGQIRVQDPWGDPVCRGEYAFRSRSGQFLRIVPCRGKERIAPAARLRLKERVDRRLARLVLNKDADAVVEEAATGDAVSTDQAAENLLRPFGPLQKNEHGEFLLDEGATVVSVASWQAADGPTDGLPGQQTLERLVCAALVAAYPQRGPCVQTWLDSRPDAPQAGPKEFGWSHMAGWYAERGGEGFYRALWDDTQIAAQLKSRLSESGAWPIAEALAE